MTQGCPATMPCGPGTQPLIRATYQQHSAPKLHQLQPQKFAVDLWPVSRASTGTSSLTTNRRPLHFTTALLYTEANTAGENPVADTKN
jgi:hypothetical protein